jgi:hypothetical protein
MIQSETVVDHRADQGVGRDVPVRGIGGDHRGVRDLRGRQGRRVPHPVDERAAEEPVAEGVLGPLRCLGQDGFGAPGPDPAGGGFAFCVPAHLLGHRLQASHHLEQRLLRLGVNAGLRPDLALCLLAVAGAAHDTSHGLVCHRHY